VEDNFIVILNIREILNNEELAIADSITDMTNEA
jgi:hypothetical protein